jgi:hypothetical protein
MFQCRLPFLPVVSSNLTFTGYSGSCFVAFHADKAEAPAFSAKDIGNKLNGADFSV